MYPILFSVGGINFYSYGLMVAFAFLATSMVTVYFAKKQKMFFPALFDYMILLFIAGIVGARLIYVALYYNQFSHWYEVFYIWQGGMVSYGGMLGVIIGLIIMFKKEFWRWADIISIGFMLGVFFWRIGCFLAGDHPSVEYNGLIAFQGTFPSVLVESVLGLVGFILFSILFKYLKNYTGYTFFLVIAYYGIVRIFVDHFRIDPLLFGLKTGQVTGIALALIGILGIIWLKFKSYKTK